MQALDDAALGWFACKLSSGKLPDAVPRRTLDDMRGAPAFRSGTGMAPGAFRGE